MKKIMVLITLLLFLTGCDINYTLKINGDNIEEKINAKIIKEDLLIGENQILLGEIKTNTLFSTIDESNHFEKNNSEINGVNHIELTSKYNRKTYKNSRLLNDCFSSNVYLNEKDYLYIKAYGKYLCGYDEKINTTVKIIISNNVIEHNAAYVKGNEYVWNINDKNKDSIDIYIQVGKEEKIEKIENSNSLVTYGVIIAAILIIGIVYFAVNKIINQRFF